MKPGRRVVVTGVGVVAPSGIGAQALWDALVAGRSEVRAIEAFDAGPLPVRIAAELRGFDPDAFLPRSQAEAGGRFFQLAAAATRLAVEDAGIAPDALGGRRSAFALGTAIGSLGLAFSEQSGYAQRGVRSLSPLYAAFASPHAAAGHIAGAAGVTGTVLTASSDCCAGLDAVTMAFRQVRDGRADVALAGGADAPILPMVVGLFARGGALARPEGAPGASCRPFDLNRTGFVLAEGAAMLVLEEARHAETRGARVYGELLGSGSAHDAPGNGGTGAGFLAAAEEALHEAGLASAALDHVNAHAPGMPATDLAEARSLRALLGARVPEVPVTSIKGALGQALGATGVLQLVTALLSIRRGEIPPTLNCDDLDPACDLDVVRGQPRARTLRTALVTAHGIAGNTTSLVVGRAAERG